MPTALENGKRRTNEKGGRGKGGGKEKGGFVFDMTNWQFRAIYVAVKHAT